MSKVSRKITHKTFNMYNIKTFPTSIKLFFRDAIYRFLEKNDATFIRHVWNN